MFEKASVLRHHVYKPFIKKRLKNEVKSKLSSVFWNRATQQGMVVSFGRKNDILKSNQDNPVSPTCGGNQAANLRFYQGP